MLDPFVTHALNELNKLYLSSSSSRSNFTVLNSLYVFDAFWSFILLIFVAATSAL